MQIIAPLGLGTTNNHRNYHKLWFKMTRTAVFSKLYDPNLEYQSLLFLIKKNTIEFAKIIKVTC